jgi:hypothetical protein
MDALLERVPDEASLPEYVPARGKARGRVAVLTGCVQRYLFRSCTPAGSTSSSSARGFWRRHSPRTSTTS